MPSLTPTPRARGHCPLARFALLTSLGLFAAATPQETHAVDWINYPNGSSGFYQDSGNWAGGAVPTSTQSIDFSGPIGNLTGVLWNDGTGNTTSSDVTVQDSSIIFTGCCGAAGIPFTHTATDDVVISNGGALALANLSNEPMNLTAGDLLQVIDGGAFTARFGSVVTAGDLGLGARAGATSGDAPATLNLQNSGTMLSVTTGDVRIGGNGATGILNVSDGAVADFGVGPVRLADSVSLGSSATVNVTSGGQITTSGEINAGTGGQTGQVLDIDVAGAGSLINQTGAGTFTVGSSANSVATVDIDSGGRINTGSGGLTVNATGTVNVNTGEFRVGGNPTATGVNAASVSVSGGALNVTGSSEINGSMDITAGSVSTELSFVGRFPGQTGSVTVDGVNSVWNVVGDGFRIGELGVGSLTVSAGSSVQSTSGTIGTFAGADGDVTVTGAGSTLDNDDDLFIGGSFTDPGGAGDLTIEADGAVVNGDRTVVYGPGAVHLNGGLLTTGSFDNSAGGTLNHTGGTLQVNGGTFDPGVATGATYTLDGAGNPFLRLESGATANLATEDIHVGATSGNSGELRVAFGNGTLSTNNGFLGFGAGSTGKATVTGSGTEWNNAGELVVGQEGSGELLVQNGGVSTSAGARVGHLAGSDGVATVRFADSEWNSSSFMLVGNVGDGALNVEAGGSVSSTFGIVGDQAVATGEVVVNGPDSTWTNSDFLIVGNFGSGTLDIEAGGSVSNTWGLIGTDSAGGAGAVTVTGAGSTWSNSLVAIGGNESGVAGGTATLTVADGGLVTSTGETRIFGGGTLNLDGGAVTTNSFTNTDGGTLNLDDGELVVDGGSLQSSGFSFDIVGGGEAADQPTLTLRNSATGSIPSRLVLGAEGGATLNVESGAQLTFTSSSTTFLGGLEGEAAVNVTGAGSRLETAGSIEVGDATEAILFVGAGATVQSGGDVALGAGFADGLSENGVATVEGNLIAGDDLLVSDGSGGTATLLVRSGGVAQADDLVSVGFGGRVEGDGAVIAASGFTNGGAVSPGELPGTLTITGDYTQTFAGSLEIDFNGPGAGEFDLLDISGAASLGGELLVFADDPSTLSLGDAATVLTAASLSGVFDTVTVLPTLDPGLRLATVLTPASAVLVVASDLLGDADGDGDVDGDDLIAVQSNFGSTGVFSLLLGDADFDGDVDGDDLIAVQSNFGSTLSTAVAVPEPTTALLLLISLAAGATRAMRR